MASQGFQLKVGTKSQLKAFLGSGLGQLLAKGNWQGQWVCDVGCPWIHSGLPTQPVSRGFGR